MEWEKTILGNIAKLVKGISYTSENYANDGDHYIFITLKCIAKAGGFNARGIKYFKGFVPERQKLKSSDLLIANTDLTRAGDIVGCPVFLPDLGGEQEITMSMDVSRLDLIDENKTDKKFLYYYLTTEPVRRFMRDHSSGSTVLHLQTSLVPSLKIEIPKEKVEQAQIADILSCIDRAIEQTEAIIAKQQRIKAGLMQDLLTKGIDEHGNIRDEAAHEFKDSPLGRIPKEWGIGYLESLYRTPIRDFGSFSSTKEITFLEEGIPFVKSEMIEVGKINWDGCSYISQEVHRKLSKSYIKEGNLLLSKIGSALGKAVVYEGEHGICNSNAAIAKIDIEGSKANVYFIAHILNWEITQRQMKNMIVSLLPRLNLGDISKILVPIPPPDEQDLIVEKLYCLDRKIIIEQTSLAKLKNIKTGLMQDLLTGKVRVNALLEAQA